MDAAKADPKPMAAAAAAKRRHRQRHLRTMAARLLRLAEAVAAALLLLSWSSSSSSRLPAAGEHLRRFASLLLSPRFVFLLGNAIVLLLFAGSRHLSPLPSPSSSPSPSPSPPPSAPNPSPDPAPVAGDLYREFLESRGYSFPAPAFEDKEAARVEMRRSKSERIGGTQQQQERRLRRRSPELRRSETDLGCRTRRKEEVVAVAVVEEEWAPSAEEAAEFRRTIEAFIAKQTNFHREESIAIVSFSPSTESSIVKTEALPFKDE